MIRKNWVSKLWFPAIVIFLMIFLHVIYYFLDTRLGLIGIYPRKVYGLTGIITAPFLHSDWRHLFSNLLPIIGLSLILFLIYERISYWGYILIHILTGLIVWLFARQVYHVGASGVVYGLVSFIFCNGIFRRDPKSIIFSLIVTFFYLGSGYFLGVLPNQRGISWESHLFGALVGVFVSFVLKDIKEKTDEKSDPLEEGPKRYYLPRDTFDRKKWERDYHQED